MICGAALSSLHLILTAILSYFYTLFIDKHEIMLVFTNPNTRVVKYTFKIHSEPETLIVLVSYSCIFREGSVKKTQYENIL